MNINEITGPQSLQPVIEQYTTPFVDAFIAYAQKANDNEMPLEINAFMKENAPKLLATIEKGVTALNNVAPDKEIEIHDVESIMNTSIQEVCQKLATKHPELKLLAGAWDELHQARMTHQREVIDKNVRSFQKR